MWREASQGSPFVRTMARCGMQGQDVHTGYGRLWRQTGQGRRRLKIVLVSGVLELNRRWTPTSGKARSRSQAGKQGEQTPHRQKSPRPDVRRQNHWSRREGTSSRESGWQSWGKWGENPEQPNSGFEVQARNPIVGSGGGGGKLIGQRATDDLHHVLIPFS